ncbi:MAG: hypothetical protein AB7J13_06175 [Pyrinomonadaceae bacterium]
MTRKISWVIGVVSIIAPGLHWISDVLEWVNGGFTYHQLLINYFAFVAMPFLIVGLCFVQRNSLQWYGLFGAVLYGVSFIYFSHTTLVALENSTARYSDLWQQLGTVYTLHGGLMISGGLLFGLDSLRIRILSRSGLAIFVFGLLLNLFVSLSTLPVSFQTLGSSMRNIGLMIVGTGIITTVSQNEENA